MKQVFTKEELAATEIKVREKNFKYFQTCSGKVSVFYDGKHIIGYIISETDFWWRILLATNLIITKQPLQYSIEKKGYIYPLDGKYKITMYWPIRIQIKSNGRGFRITLNRLAYKRRKNEYKIIDQHSS